MLSLSHSRRGARSAYAFLVFISCFVLAFAAGSLTFIPRDSSAEDADANINVTVGQAVSLYVTPQPILLLDLTPTPLGFEVTEEITASVSTNNVTGYTLTMSTTTYNTALIHANSTDNMPSTASLTPAPLPVNTWGYNEGTGAITFLEVPSVLSPDIIATSAAPIDDDITIVAIGAKADVNILPGTYSNTLVFTAVANYVPSPMIDSVSPPFAASGDTVTITGTNFYGGGASDAVTSVTIGGTACTSFNVISDTSLTCVLPTLSGGVYPIAVTTNMGTSNRNIAVTLGYPFMQFFSTQACTAMPIYPAAGAELDLIDNRDSKTYKIRKLADDNCWMVDNLALQPSGSSMVLDSTSSDLASGTYTLNTANVADPNSAAYCLSLSTATFPNRCGMQYDWTTAVVGNNPSSGTVADSVCPKNWRLPANNEYTTLQTALGWGDSGTNINNSAWRGLYAGWNGATDQGVYGYYWTATATSASLANYLYYTASMVNPIGGGLKTYQLSLRCLAR